MDRWIKEKRRLTKADAFMTDKWFDYINIVFFGDIAMIKNKAYITTWIHKWYIRDRYGDKQKAKEINISVLFSLSDEVLTEI